MNAIGSSLRDLDRPQPLIAGTIGGRISVALLVLPAALPSEGVATSVVRDPPG